MEENHWGISIWSDFHGYGVENRWKKEIKLEELERSCVNSGDKHKDQSVE